MGARGTHMVDTTQRLSDLRALMRKHNVQAFVVPSEDQHASEYIAHCDQRRAFISGFNGSAGCAVVTLDAAYLFTDGRYHFQAGKQLDKNWKLMKVGLTGVPTWQEFLHKDLGESTKIGIDTALISISDVESLKKNLQPKKSELVSITPNLVDQVWHDRPPRPKNPVFHLDVKFSGQTHTDKLARVREEIEKQKAKAVVVTMLDEVAWLFNLRGSDIDYNPVFFSYAVVTTDSATLFIDKERLKEDAHKALDDVQIQPYDAFFGHLGTLPGTLELNESSKVLLSSRASFAVAEAIGEGKYTIVRSPIEDLKAIKNETELEGFRQCHIRDGTALIRYFAWLEEQLNNGTKLNESQGADKLEQFRSELDLFRGLSFGTISGVGPNAAIIHYSPDPADCAIIKKEQIYLCDSGGQYWDGTTDVTRTLHFGTPTDQEKRAFTRVLQGHIAIDSAIFPNGTTGEFIHQSYHLMNNILTGYIIDSFARRPLWQDGLDYRHGTGHGVGQYLNVHEGPHGIGVRIAYNSVPLKPGMTISNEPGYYEDGQFGIRIENVVLVREAKTPNNFGDKGYLGFEHVTMCPMHKKLVDISLLTVEEKKWLNDYHEEVWNKVSPHLQNDQRALDWLRKECSPL
ncbi:hypothetical protein AX15_007876 [Amanita polypyramis BW_CC]|nr:hypothetical protein AX15_007876 [Amanita polypyramis BW_CC]